MSGRLRTRSFRLGGLRVLLVCRPGAGGRGGRWARAALEAVPAAWGPPLLAFVGRARAEAFALLVEDAEDARRCVLAASGRRPRVDPVGPHELPRRLPPARGPLGDG
jgi:hypothetical protein